MSFGAVVSLGIGAMIGAGIIALLGEVGATAGSAVWVSFLIGGLVAPLTGYSLGRLSARCPSASGIVEYLIHGYGEPGTRRSLATRAAMYSSGRTTLRRPVPFIQWDS